METFLYIQGAPKHYRDRLIYNVRNSDIIYKIYVRGIIEQTSCLNAPDNKRLTKVSRHYFKDTDLF